MYLMRVRLPDRPGSLGAVATAVGTTGADIRSVEIVAKTDGYAIDDFMLTMAPGVMPDYLVSACVQIEGVQVLWFSRYPEGEGLATDIETLERMSEAPEHAAEILTHAAPSVFHCEWAALVDRRARTGLVETPMAPPMAEALEPIGHVDAVRSVELEDGWLPDWGETVVALAPMRGGRALVVGRQGGPAFLGSELARLRHLCTMV